MLKAEELNKRTLDEVVNKSCEKHGEKIALASVKGDKISYAELLEKVNKVASFLLSRGINKGDKVAILAENQINWGVAYFAVTKIGAILVPIMKEFQPYEIKHILRHSESKAIFVSSKQYEKLTELECEFLETVVLIEDFSLVPKETEADFVKSVINQGKKEFQKIFDKALEFVGLKDFNINEDDLALLVYTSGTTGNSKGVMLTHGNIVSDALATSVFVPFSDNEVLLSVLPLFHTMESTVGFLTPIIIGATVYYLDKPPTATSLVPALRKVRPTVMVSVPLIIEKIYRGKILREINSSSLLSALYKFSPLRKAINKKAGKKLLDTFGGRLRLFALGGAPLSRDVEIFLREAKFPYAMGYGLTETSPLCTASDVHETKLGSAGYPLSGVSVRIASEDPQKIEGEIQIKGPNVMKGYYKDPERTAEVFTDDGWFKTGDLGIIDEDGYLFIKGRSKNMFLGANGKNIYPEEIETVINQHPAVAESLVVNRDGKIVALVFLNPDELEERFGISKKNGSEVRKIKENVLNEIFKFVNERVPTFSKLNKIEEQKEEFIKTPTHKIKRFMYK